jgi:hypothetical protein
LSTLAKTNSATPLVGYRQGNKITYPNTKQNKKIHHQKPTGIGASIFAAPHHFGQQCRHLIACPTLFPFPCTCTYTVGLGRFFSGDAALRFSGDLRLRSGEVGFFPKNPRMSIATWPWQGHKTKEKKEKKKRKKKKKRGKSLHEILIKSDCSFFFFLKKNTVHWR